MCIRPAVFEKSSFLKVIHHFWMFPSFRLLFNTDLRTLWEGDFKDILFWIECPAVDQTAYYSVVSVCVNYHLQQEVASMKGVE